MRVYFGADKVLHISPEDTTESMALQFWKLEKAEHGEKMLEVDTEVSIRLGAEK